MNIISNNCAGAAIYKYVLNTEYQNPFIWCFTDLKALVTKFDYINWKSVKLYNEQANLLGHWHLVIDKCVDLNFVHACWDPAHEIPFIDRWNVSYNRIWQYLIDKYIKRTKRMIDSKQSPIYVVNIQDQSGVTLANTLRNLTSRLIIISPQQLYPTAHITYQQSSILDPDNPITIVKGLSTKIKALLGAIKDD